MRRYFESRSPLHYAVGWLPLSKNKQSIVCNSEISLRRSISWMDLNLLKQNHNYFVSLRRKSQVICTRNHYVVMQYYNISIIHWIVWAYIYQWRIDDEMKTAGKSKQRMGRVKSDMLW
jgi:hypothetical protein